MPASCKAIGAALEADMSGALGHVSGPVKQPKRLQKAPECVGKTPERSVERYSPEMAQVEETATDGKADASGASRHAEGDGTESKKVPEALEQLSKGLEQMEEENSPQGTPSDSDGPTHETAARDAVHDTQERPHNGKDGHVDETNAHRQYPDQGGQKGELVEEDDDGGDWGHGTDVESVLNEGKWCRMVSEASGRR